MEKIDKLTSVVGTSVLALSGLGASAVIALAAVPGDAPAPTPAPVVTDAIEAQTSPAVQLAAVEGSFDWTQGEVTPTGAIASALGTAPDYLCGANEASLTDVAAEDWAISVGGEVGNPYSMTVAELQADPEVQSVLMGCSCQGNPADGRASVNAMVTGVAVSMLLNKADVAPDANTVVFTSADGYEVALPLRYVIQRYCPIVFDVNGSPIAESVGGTNQLWLGSTSARYFARDIVAITLEARDEADVPAAPGSQEAGDAYANLPNVGVYFGGEVA